jgi:hypothetical protein
MNMSDYSAFIGRMKAGGARNHKEALQMSTKRQAYNLIMNSPTSTSVEYMELAEQTDKTYKAVSMESKPSIVSDKETFYKRTMLFLPDEGVKLGSYLKYDDKIYLATNISDIEPYPQAFVEFCNYELLIKGEETRTIVGKDSLGRPQYKTHRVDYPIPCVTTSKIYSTLDNSQIPLPVGAILLYTQYHDKIKIPLNSEFDLLGDKYQITTVNPINTLMDKNGVRHGYLEIRAQRDVNKT